MLTSSNYKEKQLKVEVKVMKVKVNIPTSPGGLWPWHPPHHSLKHPPSLTRERINARVFKRQSRLVHSKHLTSRIARPLPWQPGMPTKVEKKPLQESQFRVSFNPECISAAMTYQRSISGLMLSWWSMEMTACRSIHDVPSCNRLSGTVVTLLTFKTIEGRIFKTTTFDLKHAGTRVKGQHVTWCCSSLELPVKTARHQRAAGPQSKSQEQHSLSIYRGLEGLQSRESSQ